jgi:hypothetical protein
VVPYLPVRCRHYRVDVQIEDRLISGGPSACQAFYRRLGPGLDKPSCRSIPSAAGRRHRGLPLAYRDTPAGARARARTPPHSGVRPLCVAATGGRPGERNPDDGGVSTRRSSAPSAVGDRSGPGASTPWMGGPVGGRSGSYYCPRSSAPACWTCAKWLLCRSLADLCGLIVLDDLVGEVRRAGGLGDPELDQAYRVGEVEQPRSVSDQQGRQVDAELVDGPCRQARYSPRYPDRPSRNAPGWRSWRLQPLG